MLPAKFASFLSVSLLLLSKNISKAIASTTVKYNAKLGATVQCLSEVNGAREAAGLAHFTEAATTENKISDPGASELTQGDWKKLCEYLVPAPPQEESVQSSAEPFKDGTYAFKSLTAEQPNCNETVDYWKAAYKNFTGLPPAKTKDSDLYSKQDNVSFVALYNPSSDATADCRVVTCTQTITSSSLPASQQGDEDGGAGSGTKTNGYALICKTMPDAFGSGNTPPFTEEQWNKIKSSLTGSASIAAPSLVALAIVAFGITAL